VKKRLLPRLHVALLSSILTASGLSLPGQDFSVLRINEVMTDNETTDPADSTGLRHDMVEIYNSGDVDLTLGAPTFAQRIALSDTETQPVLGIWTFPAGMTISAKGFLTVFCEADPEICDPHATFGLAKDGSEPITLWGRAGSDGKRQVIDQVFLPPLDADVSFGRFPDGAGPAPMPVSSTFDHFKFYPEGQSTFGTCQGTCANFDRVCRGGANGPGGNIAPTVSRIDHTTNSPAAGVAVDIVGRVKDDKIPTPPGAIPSGSIARVTLKFRVNGGAEEEIPMVFDEAAGVMTDPLQPLDRFTQWNATIPGQPAGALVEFSLHVEDSEGLVGGDPDPEDLCPEGVGPCNQVGLPGPNCSLVPPEGPRYVPCNVRFRYMSGYEIPARLAGLVINEVIANQTSVLQDLSDSMFDDIVELFNASDAAVDLSGLWMSDKAFHPQGYRFPAQSMIGPREHLVVWADGDGGLCPRPNNKLPLDGQDCPDPTDPAKGEYHLDFALERNGDEVYIFEEIPAADGIPARQGVIHGTEFGPQALNKAWSLTPDGSRSGSFSEAVPTPGAVNLGSSVRFKRGDSDGSCTVNITDGVFILDYLFQGGPEPTCMDAADTDDTGSVEITDPVYLLNHLFLGGPAPPPPGIDAVGSDDTADSLADCVAACT